MQAPVETVKFSLSLPHAVYSALEKEAKKAKPAEVKKLDAQEYMRWLLVQHALKGVDLDEKEKVSLKLYWAISDAAAEKALEISNSNGFSPDMTLLVVKACEADPDWMEKYRRYVGGNEFSTDNPRKTSLNQNIGYYVKRAIGAEVDQDSEGRRVVVKVSGHIIKSYTRLRMPA
jgi:hypothetical protein